VVEGPGALVAAKSLMNSLRVEGISYLTTSKDFIL
jgi:hypothetical protein